MENTVFRTSRVQRRGSKSINLSSENGEPVTPNMGSANCVLSHSESRRWRSEDGFCFPVLLSSPCRHSRQVTASLGLRGRSLSHLGLHGLRRPLRGCLTDLLQKVVHLETKGLNLLVPSWQSFTSCKEKKKQPVLNKVSLSNSLALSTAAFPFATALT